MPEIFPALFFKEVSEMNLYTLIKDIEDLFQGRLDRYDVLERLEIMEEELIIMERKSVNRSSAEDKIFNHAENFTGK